MNVSMGINIQMVPGLPCHQSMFPGGPLEYVYKYKCSFMFQHITQYLSINVVFNLKLDRVGPVDNRQKQEVEHHKSSTNWRQIIQIQNSAEKLNSKEDT